MNDSELCDYIIQGLPDLYKNILTQYEWYMRGRGMGNMHDIGALTDALLREGDRRFKEEKQKRNGTKRQDNVNSSNKREKSNETCSHYGKVGHGPDKCWGLHAELKPKALQKKDDERKARNDNKVKTETVKFSGFTAEETPDSGMALDPSSARATANSASQTMTSRGGGRVRTGGGDLEEGGLGTEDGDEIPMALAARDFDTPDVVLIDSGCSMYIFNNKKWFTKLDVDDLVLNTAGKKSSMKALGRGTVKLVMSLGNGKKVTSHIDGAMYIPEARCNLVSLGKLLKLGVEVRIKKHGMTLFHGGRPVGFAEQKNDLFYVVGLKVAGAEIQLAAAVDYKSPVMLWHRKLGYLSFQNMLTLQKESTGMNVTGKQIKACVKLSCPTCN